MNKKTRGKPSKVDSLPDELRVILHEMLRDGSRSQTQILNDINQMMTEAGIDEDLQLSRSGLNRYATKMETVGRDLRQANAVASAWTSQLGSQPESEIMKVVQELVKTLAFKTTMGMMDGQDLVSPKELAQLALICQRMEDAQKRSIENEQTIQQAYQKELAKKLTAEAKNVEQAADPVEYFRKQILGLSE